MSRVVLALMLVLAPLVCVGAEEAASTTTAPASAAKSRLPVSSETMARLTAATPKFTPPPPAAKDDPAPPARPPAAAPERPSTERLPPEVDLPRNQIIRLPAYFVEDSRIVPQKERHVLTHRAKVERMFLRHPGLHIGNLFGLNGGIAAFMVEEEERLERKREFEDLASLMSFSGPEESAKAKREVQRAFIREPDFGR